MATEEITIAEVLKGVGYKTGAFGKWHLGDNYPSRPGDQGFDESVIHLAGGMGQPGDFTTYFKFDRSYFDPVLWHNDEQESYEGYCSDISTTQALKFIEQNEEGPFFVTWRLMHHIRPFRCRINITRCIRMWIQLRDLTGKKAFPRNE